MGQSRPHRHELQHGEAPLALEEPPGYERPRRPSQLGPHKETILGLLKEDATAPSSVILERLRREGYPGGLVNLKDFHKQERPRFLALSTYQRTTYWPGEICQVDW